VLYQPCCAVADVLALLKQGTKHRHIGETRMNRESNRSHCVLIAYIKTESQGANGIRNVRTTRLNLVDLAGSEQQKSSGASGERLKEASNINKSLSILGRVINSLAQQQRGRFASSHVPYRDSKLTFLLQVFLLHRRFVSCPLHCIAYVCFASSCRCFVWCHVCSCPHVLHVCMCM
jgi:hypothetical protein